MTPNANFPLFLSRTSTQDEYEWEVQNTTFPEASQKVYFEILIVGLSCLQL